MNDDMEQKAWDSLATCLMNRIKKLSIVNKPQPEIVFIKHKSDMYFGSLQVIMPNFSKEIVLLNKTTIHIPPELVEALRKHINNEYIADDYLDLSGRQHVLRQVGNRLTQMTEDQMKYVIENMPKSK